MCRQKLVLETEDRPSDQSLGTCWPPPPPEGGVRSFSSDLPLRPRELPPPWSPEATRQKVHQIDENKALKLKLCHKFAQPHTRLRHQLLSPGVPLWCGNGGHKLPQESRLCVQVTRRERRQAFLFDLPSSTISESQRESRSSSIDPIRSPSRASAASCFLQTQA